MDLNLSWYNHRKLWQGIWEVYISAVYSTWYLHIFFSFSPPFLTPSISLNDARLQQDSYYYAPVFEMIPPLGNKGLVFMARILPFNSIPSASVFFKLLLSSILFPSVLCSVHLWVTVRGWRWSAGAGDSCPWDEFYYKSLQIIEGFQALSCVGCLVPHVTCNLLFSSVIVGLMYCIRHKANISTVVNLLTQLYFLYQDGSYLCACTWWIKHIW